MQLIKALFSYSFGAFVLTSSVHNDDNAGDQQIHVVYTNIIFSNCSYVILLWSSFLYFLCFRFSPSEMRRMLPNILVKSSDGLNISQSTNVRIFFILVTGTWDTQITTAHQPTKKMSRCLYALYATSQFQLERTSRLMKSWEPIWTMTAKASQPKLEEK